MHNIAPSSVRCNDCLVDIDPSKVKLSVTIFLYINSRGSMEYFMWAIPGSDLGQILPHIWTPP